MDWLRNAFKPDGKSSPERKMDKLEKKYGLQSGGCSR